MNYLAHAFLAGDAPEALIGNLMADFVRGKVEEMEHLSPGIRQGLLLHRAIDRFTDTHLVVQRSVGRLSPRWHHYAPILVDVFYDHFLAADWNRYASEPLAVFSERVYEILRQYQDVLPPPMQDAMVRMRRQNWFMAYGTIEGIGRALEKLSVRIWHRSERVAQLDQAVADLRELHVPLHEDFTVFFPELRHHVAEQRAALAASAACPSG
ncbi:MAG TPA: ACP phosphodiesterase [Gemmatales bacterium]|nr:ACP phosphodiesterase [Gemmatales bacterium]HMP60961.1 ACP phosphodiesterase [Gemmatales bacterium]